LLAVHRCRSGHTIYIRAQRDDDCGRSTDRPAGQGRAGRVNATWRPPALLLALLALLLLLLPLVPGPLPLLVPASTRRQKRPWQPVQARAPHPSCWRDATTCCGCEWACP
jgi:hypothetical protein